MKLLAVAVTLLFVSCMNSGKNKFSDMSGVYKMLYQRIHNDNTDTTYKTLQQLKIFTDNYMMYANFNPRDSISAFGIGNYSLNKDTVTENIFFSASDTTHNNNPVAYSLLLDKTSKGYQQIIDSLSIRGTKYRLVEEYESVGEDKTSPLDGAWRQVETSLITNDDTVTNTPTQYKVYHKGYVIWGHLIQDSMNVSHTAMGFGRFEMDGNTKMKEYMSTSTYYLVRAHNFELDISMNGPDEYTQTIHNDDGSRSVEIYKRLK